MSDAAHPNPDVATRLSHIYTLHRTDIDLRPDLKDRSQSPYLELLGKLGNPHKNLPPVVHVAGTNGKGSSLAFLRAMLEADSRRVHVYTSPHLVTFNERIRLGGKLVTDTQLIDLYDRVSAANGKAPITFFEFTTAMAFLAFAEQPADYVLLETGMGGRLDCTNVVDQPVATAITKISFDHTEFLGTTLAAIAAEKAGIMKCGVPCVIGAQMNEAEVIPVLQAHARAVGAPIISAVLPAGYPTPRLAGAHQLENAAVAAQLARILKIPEAARHAGVANAEWPARLQKINRPDLPAGWELWFDAAHNDSGALALAAQFRTWKSQDPARIIHLVLGLAADKDVDAFMKAIDGCYDSLTLVDLPNARRPQTAEQLKNRINRDAALADDVQSALHGLSDGPGIVCVAGSMYLFQQVISSFTRP